MSRAQDLPQVATSARIAQMLQISDRILLLLLLLLLILILLLSVSVSGPAGMILRKFGQRTRLRVDIN